MPGSANWCQNCAFSFWLLQVLLRHPGAAKKASPSANVDWLPFSSLIVKRTPIHPVEVHNSDQWSENMSYIMQAPGNQVHTRPHICH